MATKEKAAAKKAPTKEKPPKKGLTVAHKKTDEEKPARVKKEKKEKPTADAGKIVTAGKTVDELAQEVKSRVRQGLSLMISRVKLVKKEFLSISYNRIDTADGSTVVVNEDHKSPVHPDLKAKLLALRVHLALLCDYISTKQLKDITAYNQELVDNFTVTSISIGGKDDNKGIVLTGYKKTNNNKVVILNTPFARLEEVEETRYRYMDDLSGRIDELLKEVELYVGGKRGESPQQELNFGGASEDEDAGREVSGEENDLIDLDGVEEETAGAPDAMGGDEFGD